MEGCQRTENKEWRPPKNSFDTKCLNNIIKKQENFLTLYFVSWCQRLSSAVIQLQLFSLDKENLLQDATK